MKTRFNISFYIYTILLSIIANSYLIIRNHPLALWLIVPLFLLINVLAGVFSLRTQSKRLTICYHGSLLLSVFAISVLLSFIIHIVLAIQTIPENHTTFLWSSLFCIGVHVFLFWNGIICVYVTSGQLGVKHRVIGVICGMIPIANLFALNSIIRITLREVFFEVEKEQVNVARKAEQICATKYPLLLVHGVFFRDTKYFNYWGRIPKELEQNGAKIYYGNHSSAASVADSAAELSARIKEILKETGAEKINIIAHSKGGLDCRYALSELDMAPYIASLTTINTPHKGCLFADYLLTKIPEKTKSQVASLYNKTLKKLGEESPDFLLAVNNLTDSYCQELNTKLHTPSDVYCQSVGSVMPKAAGGTFPLNFSYHLVKYFDGPNDGLVSANSFEWGENYTLLEPVHNRGISHGDMIDLNRENIDGFDVREFYVKLVSDLKNRGL